MSLSPEYKPGITQLVVQKRHHTRFFPSNADDGVSILQFSLRFSSSFLMSVHFFPFLALCSFVTWISSFIKFSPFLTSLPLLLNFISFIISTFLTALYFFTQFSSSITSSLLNSLLYISSFINSSLIPLHFFFAFLPSFLHSFLPSLHSFLPSLHSFLHFFTFLLSLTLFFTFISPSFHSHLFLL